MGRNALFDRAADPWVIVLLNLPALVIIVPAYIWAGLNEAAAIRAVALNKLPVTVTIREGVRALYARLDEMARVFCFSRPKRLAHVVAPQLAPYFAAATRAGLSLVWKIVLVVELIGRRDAVLERLMPSARSCPGSAGDKGHRGHARSLGNPAIARDPSRRTTSRYPTADAVGERRSSCRAQTRIAPDRAWW